MRWKIYPHSRRVTHASAHAPSQPFGLTYVVDARSASGPYIAHAYNNAQRWRRDIGEADTFEEALALAERHAADVEAGKIALPVPRLTAPQAVRELRRLMANIPAPPDLDGRAQLADEVRAILARVRP